MYTKHESTRTTTPSSSSSFSSSLLDSIYRSIDESTESNSRNDLNFYKERRKTTTTNMVKKQNNINGDFNIERERSSLRRKAIMIEKWMDKQNGIDVAKAKSFATSSSSNSSIGRVFSSSSDESCCGEKTKLGLVFSRQQESKPLKQEKRVEGFSKSTKLKAMRNIYTELKKVKQPSSPGGKLASFITSIFNSSSNNAKKVSICSSSSSINAMEDISRHADYKSKSKSMSSRSSLTRDHQTPTSPRDHNSKYVNDMKRRLARSNYSPQVTKSCSLREIMIKNNNSCNEVNAYNINIYNEEDEEEDEEINDALSCSSSDLFELEHIIINGRYREELPVFETTSVKTNQAIANSFLTMY